MRQPGGRSFEHVTRCPDDDVRQGGACGTAGPIPARFAGSVCHALFGYATWRDSKTALMIFSKNDDFSGVLANIADFVPRHSGFKRLDKHISETHLRNVFGQQNDPSREVHLAVLVFNIPFPDAA